MNILSSFSHSHYFLHSNQTDYSATHKIKIRHKLSVGSTFATYIQHHISSHTDSCWYVLLLPSQRVASINQLKVWVAHKQQHRSKTFGRMLRHYQCIPLKVTLLAASHSSHNYIRFTAGCLLQDNPGVLAPEMIKLHKPTLSALSFYHNIAVADEPEQEIIRKQ